MPSHQTAANARKVVPKKTSQKGRRKNVLAPQPGPQTKFLETDADIAIYGGAAGGGKTFAALLDHVRWRKNPNYRGLILRRIAADLTGPGSIWEEADNVFGVTGSKANSSKLVHTWPSGAKVAFGHCQHEKDLKKWQGKQLTVITLEEVTHFTERQFWYLNSRLRSKAGIRPYLRATCNPDPDSFIRKLIDWWIDPETGYAIPERSGVKRWFCRKGDEIVWADTQEEAAALAGKKKKSARSLTFVLAMLADNPAMTDANPDYESQLEVLSLVDQEQLAKGNWNISFGAGTFFKDHWFLPTDGPAKYPRCKVRGWDFASTKPHEKNKNPDWTRGILMSREYNGDVIIEERESLQDGPAQVEELVMATAERDKKGTIIAFYQDPGQAGAFQAEKLAATLRQKGFTVDFVQASSSKIDFARPLAKAAKAGKVKLVGFDGSHEFKTYMHKFPSKDVKDDDPDAAARAYNTLEKYSPWSEEPIKAPNIVPARSTAPLRASRY